MKRAFRNRRLLGRAANVILLIGALVLIPVLKPSLSDFLGKAAAASAMLQLPEGGLSYLQNRFRDALVEDEPEAPASSSPQEPWVDPDVSSQWESEATEPSSAVEEPTESPAIETIAPEHRGTITEQTFSADKGSLYIPLTSGYIKNSTKLSNEAVQKILETPMDLALENTADPQVLIVHTHATESFEPFDRAFCDTSYTWRNTDNTKNVVYLGDIITKQLEDAGIGVVHDITQHDYPSYNGSYERSAATIKKWLALYPSIKVVIDVHRDAIESPAGNLIKPICTINGEKTAQVMIISGCDDGTMNIPNWQKNLRWAVSLQQTTEADYPGLTRPIFFCYRKYNMDLTTGSLLIEFGSHGNTLEETARAAEYVGKSMAKTLKQTLK